VTSFTAAEVFLPPDSSSEVSAPTEHAVAIIGKANSNEKSGADGLALDPTGSE